MFKNYRDYMYFLLPAALKSGKKISNQFYLFFHITGKMFDEIKSDLFKLRKEAMIVSSSASMLTIHGSDRNTKRLNGEGIEAYRNRIAMKPIIAEKAGTKEGIMLVIAALGYKAYDVLPMRERNAERWAEFLVMINMSVNDIHPIGFDVLQSEVRAVKEASALDNYLFNYIADKVTNEEYISFKVAYKLFIYYFNGLRTDGTWQLDGTKQLNGGAQEYPIKHYYKAKALKNTEYIGKIKCNEKHNIHYTDGTWQTDGTILLDAYDRTEVL